MAEFSDRAVLVTGSSSGIGEQIARRFAELGASVVVNSSTSVAAGEQIAAELGDTRPTSRPTSPIVSRRAPCRGDGRALRNARRARQQRRLDDRVDHRDLDALTDDIFLRTFEVNVFGTWWLTKAAIPHLRNSADGNIVNITSIAGLRPVGSSMAYAMSKAALNQMTLLLAKSYGPIGSTPSRRVWWPRRGRASGPTCTPGWRGSARSVACHARRCRRGDPGARAQPLREREIMVVDGGFTQVV